MIAIWIVIALFAAGDATSDAVTNAPRDEAGKAAVAATAGTPATTATLDEQAAKSREPAP